MKNKGFTLVELLAVIVILAIIALIAIPLIGNVIEKAKIGALENSVNGLVESADMYYANETIKGSTVTETTFDWKDGVQTSDSKLEYKGKVYNGKLILHANGEVAVCVDDEEHYAYKNKDSDEIVSGKGACLYDGTTGDFSSNSSINDLRGKTLVATDITESADGLNAIIKIPEEGHYDETSSISVPIETINSNLNNNEYYLYGGQKNSAVLFIKNQNYSKMTVNLTAFGNGGDTVIGVYGFDTIPDKTSEINSSTPFYSNQIGSVSEGYDETFEIEIPNSYKYICFRQASGTYQTRSHIQLS